GRIPLGPLGRNGVRERSRRLTLSVVGFACVTAAVAVGRIAFTDEGVVDIVEDVVAGLPGVSTNSSDVEGGSRLHVASTPPGATVRVDRKSIGRTPVDAMVAPGHHSVALEGPGIVDDVRQLEIRHEGRAL